MDAERKVGIANLDGVTKNSFDRIESFGERFAEGTFEVDELRQSYSLCCLPSPERHGVNRLDNTWVHLLGARLLLRTKIGSFGETVPGKERSHHNCTRNHQRSRKLL